MLGTRRSQVPGNCSESKFLGTSSEMKFPELAGGKFLVYCVVDVGGGGYFNSILIGVYSDFDYAMESLDAYCTKEYGRYSEMSSYNKDLVIRGFDITEYFLDDDDDEDSDSNSRNFISDEVPGTLRSKVPSTPNQYPSDIYILCSAGDYNLRIQKLYSCEKKIKNNNNRTFSVKLDETCVENF